MGGGPCLQVALSSPHWQVQGQQIAKGVRPFGSSDTVRTGMLSADAFAAGLFGYNAPLSLSGVCLKVRGPGECGG